jgi:ABC-type dipeptide/oligopeptide/nickel transport system permease component
MQAVIIAFTLMYVLAALFVDIMYAYIDPRIRYA